MDDAGVDDAGVADAGMKIHRSRVRSRGLRRAVRRVAAAASRAQVRSGQVAVPSLFFVYQLGPRVVPPVSFFGVPRRPGVLL